MISHFFFFFQNNKTGKSSFAKILTAYCARQGGQCVYVDLDPGQGLPIPGVISAIPIVRPYSVTDGFDPVTPLSYFFGHPSPIKEPKTVFCSS